MFSECLFVYFYLSLFSLLILTFTLAAFPFPLFRYLCHPPPAFIRNHSAIESGFHFHTISSRSSMTSLHRNTASVMHLKVHPFIHNECADRRRGCGMTYFRSRLRRMYVSLSDVRCSELVKLQLSAPDILRVLSTLLIKTAA